MKKKIFFIVSSLKAGGAERVFWLISQYFNQTEYDVSLVVFDSREPFFSPSVAGLRVVDIKTIRASRSFLKLLNLIKKERPFAIFSTGGEVNMLMAFISIFVFIPVLIVREVSVAEMIKFGGSKAKFWNLFKKLCYKRYNITVCQSIEIKQEISTRNHISDDKLVVIPNPVLPIRNIKSIRGEHPGKRLIVVGRLAKEKGLYRLLDILKELPPEYSLTIAGDGPLREDLIAKTDALELNDRVRFLGIVTEITDLIITHEVFVLPSFVEGFPNAVLDALSVGIPVVAFRVSGISELIRNGFNGYIVEQNDINGFRDCVLTASTKKWNSAAIVKDVNNRFGIQKVVSQYESLVV